MDNVQKHNICKKILALLVFDYMTICTQGQYAHHELNCILLLDYKFILLKYDINNVSTEQIDVMVVL
jgi:hypothetical protein